MKFVTLPFQDTNDNHFQRPGLNQPFLFCGTTFVNIKNVRWRCQPRLDECFSYSFIINNDTSAATPSPLVSIVLSDTHKTEHALLRHKLQCCVTNQVSRTIWKYFRRVGIS
jgi:hypothetical protein